MKKNYLVTAFQKTAAQRFPEQAEALNWALEKRLAELREENAGATPEEKFHSTWRARSSPASRPIRSCRPSSPGRRPWRPSTAMWRSGRGSSGRASWA